MTMKHWAGREMVVLLEKAWQKEKNTNLGPAGSGHWESGPENTGGVYGWLYDKPFEHVIFNEDKKKFESRPNEEDEQTFDNRKGLQDPLEAVFVYNYKIVNKRIWTHTQTWGFKLGAEVHAKAKAEFLGTGGEAGVKFIAEFNYQSQKANGEEHSEEKTIEKRLNVKVPKGKVYTARITSTVSTITVPFETVINVSGTTHAWFSERVDGHYHWYMDAGAVCRLIREHRLAGDDSHKFMTNPQKGNEGIIISHGEWKGLKSFNFKSQIFDVTDNFGRENQEVILTQDTKNELPIPGILVEEREIDITS